MVESLVIVLSQSLISQSAACTGCNLDVSEVMRMEKGNMLINVIVFVNTAGSSD